MSDTALPSSLVTAAAAFGLVAGLALAGAGLFLHLELSGALAAGQCDGCEPWHPLFVVGPLVVGSVVALGAGAALAR